MTDYNTARVRLAADMADDTQRVKVYIHTEYVLVYTITPSVPSSIPAMLPVHNY